MVGTYEYGRIARLAQSLANAGIAGDLVEQIMDGGETIRKTTLPEIKADWMREAMQRMDQLLDSETRFSVREACACCLGGKRQELAKKIAQQYVGLEDRIKAANETKYIFGDQVILLEDGKIRVRFSPEGLDYYRCVCLPKAREPLSITYCYCCGGHVKHHLQIALGRELTCQALSSAVSSGGKKPCTFLFTVKETT
jgi:hypothetical protein